MPLTAGEPAKPPWLNSNHSSVRKDLEYKKEDLLAVEEWVKRHVETTWSDSSHISTPVHRY